MVGPNRGAILVANDRYGEISIGPVPQPIPMPGSPVPRRTNRQANANYQRAGSLQHEALSLDARPAIYADGTSLGILVVNPITTEHMVRRHINHSSVRR